MSPSAPVAFRSCRLPLLSPSAPVAFRSCRLPLLSPSAPVASPLAFSSDRSPLQPTTRSGTRANGELLERHPL